ncbi:unnamed protein product, partial [Rotaria sp. Silwood2]
VDRDTTQRESHQITINITNNTINVFLRGYAVDINNHDNENDHDDDRAGDNTSSSQSETETEYEEIDEKDMEESIHDTMKNNNSSTSDQDHVSEKDINE